MNTPGGLRAGGSAGPGCAAPAVFTLVWIAWANGSLHHKLHGHEDARARSTFLLQILLLVAMAAFIPEAGGARGRRVRGRRRGPVRGTRRTLAAGRTR